MEKLLLWRSKITKWFSSRDYSNWKSLFLILSVLLTVFVTLFVEYDSIVFWFAIVTSSVISWSISCIGTATVKIESGRVSLAWGFINYSLFVAITPLFNFKQEWGTSYVIGLFFAFVCSILLTCFCSYISYLLKLNEEKEDSSFFHNKESKFNRCLFYTFVVIVSLVIAMENEGKQIMSYHKKQETEHQNIIFSKEKWYPVTEWHTEIIEGNTVYVVKCDRGRIGVYPSIYPKIRDINNKTQIKYIAGKQKYGLIFPERLEIKN